MRENTGVLWLDPRPQDDRAGAQSRIIYKVNQEDGQWDLDMPTDNEIQVSLYTETSSCTNHACSNPYDAQVNRMLRLGLISADKVAILTKYKFIVDGKFNTSESWNAVKSATSYQIGNYLYKPWDSARNDGMIPEALRPFGRYTKLADFYNPEFSAECYEAAEICKQIFNVQYEIVGTDHESLQYHVKQAPLSLITGVCAGWGGNVPVPACSLTSGHATSYYGEKVGEYMKDFDSYNPNRKKLAWDYKIGYAIKGVVTLRDDVTKLEKFSHQFTTQMQFGDSNNEVRMLQVALFIDGSLYDSEWPTQEHVQKWGGFFGENTVEAVKKFQKKYGIEQVGRVGAITLKKLNSLFA